MTEAEASLSELERKLELVIQSGLLLTQNVDLQRVVQSAVDTGRHLCGARFGAFFYHQAEAGGDSYLLHTVSGVDREKFSLSSLPGDTGVFAPAFHAACIVRSADMTKDPKYTREPLYYGMPSGSLLVRSYLTVPVKAQSGEVLGTLLYGHEQPNIFNQKSEDLVATIAAQASVAIENARLREQLNQKAADLKNIEMRQKELAAIIESSDDAILSKDLTGRVMSWNRAATRLLGYSSEEMIGQSILKLIPPELHPDESVILSKIQAGERIEHFETVRVTKNGDRLDVSLTISPVRDDSGKIVGASKILRDISSKKRIAASLLQAEKIAATGRMAATIAHEINNPLEAVVNLLYLAKVKATDPEQIDYLLTAENEVARVSHIAKQTLGYYRENVSAVGTSLSDLASEAVNVYEPRCTAAGILLKRELHSTQKIVLRKGEIMQVVSNLIANAIYAMPSGGTLTVATSDVQDNNATEGVVLSVEDDGIGIPAAQLSKIFDAFFTTRSTIGTGIGLYVAAQFVEGHGGHISVESSIDPASHGTKMSIFLPVRNPYSEPHTALEANDLPMP